MVFIRNPGSRGALRPRIPPLTPSQGGGRVSTGFVADGDSITSGNGESPSYPKRLGVITGKTIVNLGVSGRRLAEMESTFESRGVAGYYNAATANTLIILGGTNDLSDDTTAATLQSLITSYCAKARAAGYKIIVGTIPPRQTITAPRLAEKTAYNTWLRANYRSIADALADFDAIPEFATPSDTRWFTDGLHPTAAGFGFMAQVARAASGLPMLDLPQKVSNGQFGVDLADWKFYSFSSGFAVSVDPTIASLASSRMRLTIASAEKIFPQAEITLSDLTIGETYDISVGYRGTAVNNYIRVLNRPGDYNNPIKSSGVLANSGGPFTYSSTFVAEQTSQIVSLTCNTSVVSSYSEFDDVSVT